MHSDFWAGVPYEDCPSHVQHNIRVIGRMNAFRAAAKANSDALAAYVEGRYQGLTPEKAPPVAVPSVDDEEMEDVMEQDIKDAARVAELLLGDEAAAVSFFLASWARALQRESDYLAYNRKALEKRYRKGADQKEIDRVQKLISDGEEEIAFLKLRIQWATDQRS